MHSNNKEQLAINEKRIGPPDAMGLSVVGRAHRMGRTQWPKPKGPVGKEQWARAGGPAPWAGNATSAAGKEPVCLTSYRKVQNTGGAKYWFANRYAT
jgi:hypothetical protein